MQSIVRHAFGWRILHWVIASLVLTTIPIGLTMASRAEANIFDAVTNTLYAAHKSIGFTVLSLMILRIAMKAGIGAPAYRPAMPRGLVIAAKSVHYLFLCFAGSDAHSGMVGRDCISGAHYRWRR